MSAEALSIFRARAQARAQMFYVGLYRNVTHAMEPLLSEAIENGLFKQAGAVELRGIINEELEKLGMPKL